MAPRHVQCPRCRFKLGCCEGETGECRDALEQLEASDLDVDVALAWLVQDEWRSTRPSCEAAGGAPCSCSPPGGDPHRDARHRDSVAAERLAEELDTPERASLAPRRWRHSTRAGSRGYREPSQPCRTTPSSPGGRFALALLADELAED